MQHIIRQITTFLYLVYFLLYVVSPLCYAADRISENSTITHATTYNIKNIQVIWELVLSKLLQKENSEDNHSRVQFFIKKAKAVLNSNNTIKAVQSGFVPPQPNEYFSQRESIIFSAVFTDADPQQGFYSAFSGLSPPVFNS